MKFKLLLTMFIAAPFVVMGQDNIVQKGDTGAVSKASSDTIPESRSSVGIADPAVRAYTTDKPVLFYNEGAVFFDAKAGASNFHGEASLLTTAYQNNPVMFVDGSMEANKPSAGTATTFKMTDRSAIAVTGDVENLVFDMTDHTEGTGPGAVTTKCETGMVWFVSTPADVALNIPLYIASDAKAASLELGGQKLRKKQRILSYNVLPNIVVDEYSFVSLELDANAGTPKAPTALQLGQVNPATPAVRKGKLIVGSGGLFSMKASYSTTTARHLAVPSLLIAGEVNRLDKAGVKGQVMYDLELYNNGAGTGGAGQNTILANAALSGNANPAWVKTKGDKKILTPFVSPFKGLGADHMLFNVLTFPHIGNIGGGAEGPVVDPTKGIVAGQPFFVGLDINSFDYAEIETRHSVNRNDRATRGYQFNRDYFLAKHANFNKSAASMFDQEVFTTLSDGDITFKLTKGLNFLVNPYAAMFDYAELITIPSGNSASLSGDWLGSATPISVANKPGQVPLGTVAVRPTLWFPANTTIQYYKYLENGFNPIDIFEYNLTYEEHQLAGGVHQNAGTKMGPLTMFAIQASGDAVLKLPKTKLSLPGKADDNPITPRSLFAANERVDEILLETQIRPLDSAGDDYIMADKLSIVLRDNASFAYRAEEAASDDYIDNEKMVGTTGPSSSKRSSGEYDGLSLVRKYPGVLYSLSSDQLALGTTAIPTTVKQLPIYFTPTASKSRVVLRPSRLETLESVSRLWLLDKFTDKVVELTGDTEYEFISEPLDSETLANENRFVLYFDVEPNNGDGGNVIGKEMPIYCYYNLSTLTVRQLNDNDMGSKVTIYDLQGRLAGETTITYVDGEGKFEFMKPLAYGTYIVKIAGKRNYRTKIMVTP